MLRPQESDCARTSKGGGSEITELSRAKRERKKGKGGREREENVIYVSARVFTSSLSTHLSLTLLVTFREERRGEERGGEREMSDANRSASRKGSLEP